MGSGTGPASTTYSLGQTGGQEQVTLSVDELPIHQHITYNPQASLSTDGNHQHSFQDYGGTANQADIDYDGYDTLRFGGGQNGTAQAGLHTHDVNLTEKDGRGIQYPQQAQAANPHENMPPYYVLIYIMYTG